MSTPALETTCASYIFGRRMRLTRVDNCGRPVSGDCNTVVTSGFISVEVEPEIEDGEEVTVKNAAGEVCVSQKACDSVKWLTATITMCEVDPAVMSLISPSWRKHIGTGGAITGVHLSNKIDCDQGFALEIWMDVVSEDNSVCQDVNSQGAYGYLLIPYIASGQIGSFTVEADALQLEFTGNSRTGSSWGHGPYNVEVDAAGNPVGLLTPVKSDESLVIATVGLAPPDAKCGCQKLVVLPPPKITSANKDTTDNTGMTVSLVYTFDPSTVPTVSKDTLIYWDWKDGNPGTPTSSTAEAAGAPTTVTHKYDTAGTYMIKVCSKDKPYTCSGTATVVVPFQ